MAARAVAENNVSKLSVVVGVNQATLDTYLDIFARLSPIIRHGHRAIADMRSKMQSTTW